MGAYKDCRTGEYCKTLSNSIVFKVIFKERNTSKEVTNI